MNEQNNSCIGLIPAAGQASRLGRSPCSKEIYPLGHDAEGRQLVMADCLLNGFRHAGIQTAYFILRSGKWDIPAYFGDGSEHDLDVGYLIAQNPWGSPFTLDSAYPFIRGKRVATGFPDIQFTPSNLFSPMLDRLDKSDADVVLASIPQAHGHKWDMIAFDEAQQVSRIEIKRPDTLLTHCWFAAVWEPAFTEFMHSFLAEFCRQNDPSAVSEIHLGTVMQAAIEKGLKIECEIFNEGSALDLGTISDLQHWKKNND